MQEIQRQVPQASGVERRALVAAVLCTGLGILLGIYVGGLFGPLLAGAAGGAGLILLIADAHAGVRRSTVGFQAFADELFQELEIRRREETRLRAVARSMAAENEESEHRRRDAETAERTKAAFIKTLSQELRTPLANVLGMSGILLETELDEGQTDYARTIHGASEALLVIIDDVLALSYINAGALEIEQRELELTYCVESVVETCKAKLNGKTDGPQVECRLDPSLPAWIIGDRGRLRQILLAVLERAVERSPGGRVVLSADLAEDDATGLLLRFEVVDSGETLDAYARERMFDEYPAHEGGTGMLGLAVARQLARLMGGDMGVEDRSARGTASGRISSPGREHGTIVWMTARFGASRRGTAGERPEEGVELTGLRVLLVDSAEESRAAFCKTGAALGLELTTAATAAEGLQLLKDAGASGKAYQVALIDADLSDIGGRDFGELLKSVPEASGTGLVLLRPVGAFDRPTDLARHGFDAWISKPVSEVRLRTVLLHVTAEPVGERSAREGSGPRPQPKQLAARVLLAEDNIVNQKVAELFLTQIGCSVEVARTGMQAIEKVMAGDFDLVLMDCLMPEIDGYDATRAIRLLSDPVKSRVPIVAMTAGSQPDDRETCTAAGMDDQVTKPVRLEELMRVVRHWSASTRQPSTESNMYDSSLDPEVIATLRDLGGDDPSIFNELVELFLADTPPRIRALEAALASGNPKDLEAAAHSLKSSSGNLGAYVLSGLFKELETMGRSKDIGSAGPLVEKSREEYHRVEVALREEMD